MSGAADRGAGMNWAREFRKFRGRRFTQRQLALALGITRRAVIYIEQGEREPRIRTIDKFKELREKHGKRKTLAASVIGERGKRWDHGEDRRELYQELPPESR